MKANVRAPSIPSFLRGIAPAWLTLVLLLPAAAAQPPPRPPGPPSPAERARQPGPWDQDIQVYRVPTRGTPELLTKFARGGVATAARLGDGRLVIAHQHFPENNGTGEGGIWTATSLDGTHWEPGRPISGVRVADPGTVVLRDGALLVAGTGPPRPGTPSAQRRGAAPNPPPPPRREPAGMVFPGSTWAQRAPGEVGLDAARLDAFAANVGGDGVVIKDGYLVKTWGEVATHKWWASASKPVFSTLLLLAVQERKLPDVDAPVKLAGWDLSPKDAPMTFRQLANMTSGYGCAEAPGAAWGYNDFAIQLYARSLEKIFGQPLADAFQQRFAMLQFEDGAFFGHRNNLGVVASPRDFARLGWLWLNRGRWAGEAIIAERFFAENFRPQVPVDLPRAVTKERKPDDYLGLGSYGGGTNQTPHGPGVYGFNFWFNAPTPAGARVWPAAPPDVYQANGMWNRDTLTVFPGLRMVVAVRAAQPGRFEPGQVDSTYDQNMKLLVDAANRAARPTSLTVFPGREWETAAPESQRVDAAKLRAAVALLENTVGKDGARELVIVRHGRMIWHGDDIDKVHGVWSFTKSFTSTALGLLIDDGKCTLDTKAKDVLPAMAGVYPAVTLRHFATMTSGYRAVGDEPQGAYAHGPSVTPFTPGPEPLFTPPGSRFAYWDSAMNQFANVLTRIAGESLEELIQRRIADPIGMNREKWDWGDWKQVDGLVVNGGSGNKSGALKISAREAARFGLLFLNRGRWGDRRLLSARWIDEATRVQVPADVPHGFPPRADGGPGEYGFNWWVNGLKPDGRRKFPDAPPRTYCAAGHNNNRCFVIPEWDMVIVRLGLDGSAGDKVWNAFLAKVGEAIAR